jgi:DNA-binding MarR family transcriptional regulator
MLRIDIRGDLETIKRSLTDLQQKKVPTAASRALNKTIGNIRTQASKSIREERALSARVVRDALTVKKTTKTQLVASLTASGRPIPLREYQARAGKRGVTVKVSPGGRKLVRHAGNKAFALAKFGGHIYARTGKERLPIKKLYGPSIPSTFVKDKVTEALDKVGGESWPKRFAEELQYELSKGA